jgi:hypothetical protein
MVVPSRPGLNSVFEEPPHVRHRGRCVSTNPAMATGFARTIRFRLGNREFFAPVLSPSTRIEPFQGCVASRRLFFARYIDEVPAETEFGD